MSGQASSACSAFILPSNSSDRTFTIVGHLLIHCHHHENGGQLSIGGERGQSTNGGEETHRTHPQGSVLTIGAPVKRASARVKVPSVQLDGSAPQTVPTASPRGGVGSRHGVEPAGRNEHMNHRGGGVRDKGRQDNGRAINEPRKSTPSSRTPQVLVKAAESESGPTVVGSGNRLAGSAWTTCREVTLG
jgi:hypothetical protein